MLHIPDFDYQTHHYTFRSALETIAAWSDAHPMHVPLAIHIETKEGTVADALPNFGLTTSVPFDAAAAAAIDTEIRAVFAESRLITPDEVRGAHATLEEAVLAGGWPTVAAARGRILFFMEGGAVDEYVAGAPGLAGRLVFANGQPGEAHAAVVIANDATGGQAAIADMVSAATSSGPWRTQGPCRRAAATRRRATRRSRAAPRSSAPTTTGLIRAGTPRAAAGPTTRCGSPAAARRAPIRSTAAPRPSVSANSSPARRLSSPPAPINSARPDLFRSRIVPSPPHEVRKRGADNGI